MLDLQSAMVSIVMRKARHAAEEFNKACVDPLRAQHQKMLSIVRKNMNTEYGVRYGFSTIRTIKDFQRQVPVISYEDIRQNIDRVADGARNVLTAEPPIMFARTSGSMGKPKLIIVTPTCRGAEHSFVSSVWGYHVLKSHPDIVSGKIVTLTSIAVEGYTGAGIPYGSTSGDIYKNMPIIFRRNYSIPYEVFTIKDFQAKYYTIMRISMEHNARVIGTANPSSILKMCEKGDQFSELIIRDIYDGTLSHNFEIEPKVRETVEKKLTPDRERGNELASLRNDRLGRLIPADYWPNLKLITCWKGGTVGHYIKKFPQWFDPDGNRNIPIRDWGYLSSEARCSIPLTDHGSAGVLAVKTNFYEFVDVDEQQANPDNPQGWTYLTADQLKDGCEYYIFLTTIGGLYRYDINDIIRVEGFYHKTPQIAFVRKGRDMTNMTGEKISVNQVLETIERMSSQTGIFPSHYDVEADIENSRYILRAELDEDIADDKAQFMLQYFDENLKMLNIEYNSKRQSLRIENPVLHLMKKGWYEKLMIDMVNNGSRIFQSKDKVLKQETRKDELTLKYLKKIIEL